MTMAGRPIMPHNQTSGFLGREKRASFNEYVRRGVSRARMMDVFANTLSHMQDEARARRAQRKHRAKRA